MLTVYGILLVSNLQGDDQFDTKLKSLVSRYKENPQGLYDELCRLNALTEPAKEEDCLCISPVDPVWKITLKNGEKAGLYVRKESDFCSVFIIKI